MPTWLKVTLLAVGLLVVLLVAAVIAGVYAVRRYGPELVEAGKQTVAEGEEYGRGTDNEGCLNEAVARQARAEGFRDIIKNNIFTRACLEASRPTPGFCDGVPHAVEFMKAIAWQAQQCKHYGLPPEKQCSQLFQQVQQFCETHHMVRNENANEGTGVDEGEPPPPPPPLPAPTRPARAR
ncbi:MAG: hypothetical protein QOE46_2624 [Acidobacteriota bacterium]|jgi:hypothetical protein|nr:hypothetical protein [Acidobacteriota bacterium]